jgi:hypothetical protein
VSAALQLHGRQKVSDRLITWLAARYGHLLDVRVFVANAEEQAARTGKVRNVDGLARSLVTNAALEAEKERRLEREHLSRETARYAKAYVEALRITAREQPGPRILADTLEAVERNGYPRLRAVIDELRRLGDFWPAT